MYLIIIIIVNYFYNSWLHVPFTATTYFYLNQAENMYGYFFLVYPFESLFINKVHSQICLEKGFVYFSIYFMLFNLYHTAHILYQFNLTSNFLLLPGE